MNAPPPLPPPPPAPPARRPVFVNVLAWLMLGGCGLILVSTFGQIAALGVLSHNGALDTWQQRIAADPESAGAFASASRWLPWLIAVGVLRALAGVAAAVGLLKRREWGRKLALVVLLFAAVWQCVAIPLQWSTNGAVQHVMMKVMTAPAMAPPSEAMRAQMEASLVAGRIMGVGLALVFAALYAWLAWKLGTPGVREEFAPAAPPGTASATF